MSDDLSLEDDGEGFCEGDPDPFEDVNWSNVVKLDRLQRETLAVPDDDRPMAMLGLLSEMYGDDLQVL